MKRTIPALSLMSAALAGGLVMRGAACAGDAPSALPADVTAFLERAEGCIHWAGEPVDSDPESEPRRREIARALKELKCDRIVSEATRLRQRYITSPSIVKAIDEGRKGYE